MTITFAGIVTAFKWRFWQKVTIKMILKMYNRSYGGEQCSSMAFRYFFFYWIGFQGKMYSLWINTKSAFNLFISCRFTEDYYTYIKDHPIWSFCVLFADIKIKIEVYKYNLNKYSLRSFLYTAFILSWCLVLVSILPLK